MSHTRKILERIRERLQQNPPDNREALRLAKDLLIHGVCSQEQEALRQASLLLLERLVQPALAGTQEKQARVGRLIRQMRTAPRLNQQAITDELREIGSWMTELGSRMQPPEPEPAFPAALLQEALITLGGRAIQDIFPADKPADWSSMPLHLGAILHRERKERAEGEREQAAVQRLLARTTQAMVETMHLIGADMGDLPLLLDALRREEPMTDWVAIQEALQQALHAFQERAVAMRHRLREMQDVVERSRVLIRHADWALMETRDERLLDVFTGLPNRFGLLARLEQAKHVADAEGFVLIVIFLAEYAETVRDLGRDRVNRLMGAIAGRMVSLMRPGDYLARYNDETFVLLGLQRTTQEAMDLAGQWRDILDRTRFELSDALLTVRTSYGVACYEQGENTETLLGLAAIAAQEALAEGGERVRAVPSRQKPPPPKRLFGML
ncbi:MAG: diguanylate cyclase [Magnetococcales bacterium]|nr:diguanylate cyclase [Magnetococcales bacterium]